MIPSSTAFAQAVSQDSRTFKAQLLYNGSEIDCSITSIYIHKGACDDFAIGALFSSYIEADVSGLSMKLENKEVELKIGVNTGSAYEYITIGKYTVYKPKSTTKTTSFTAYGRISKLTGIPFVEPETKTIGAILQKISTLSGLEIVTTGFNLTGEVSAAMVNMTCWEALACVVFLLGGFATETYDGKIKIHKFGINPQQAVPIDGGRMFSDPVVNDEDYDLTGVKVIVSAESKDEEGEIIEEVSYEAGDPIREVYQSPFMTQALFSQFSTNCLGYEFRPGEVDISLGDPRLEAEDVLYVTDDNEDTYYVPCHQITHTYDGGVQTKVSAQATSESDEEPEGGVMQQLSRINSQIVAVDMAASTAKASADSAKISADKAIEDAGRAQQSADEASSSASTALSKANEAASAASSAQSSANTAQTAANQAVTDAASASTAAAEAGRSASLAQSAAEAAQGEIDEQQDYFYHDSQGAHIVSGSNSNYRTDVTSDGMSITEIATGKIVAFFRAAGATIGKVLSNRFEIKSNKLEAYDSNNNKYFEVSSSGMMFGAFQAASTDDVDEVEVKADTAINAADDAATKATGFIKPTSSEGGQDDGVMIFPKAEEGNPQNCVYIDTDSVDIYREGNIVATFSGDKIGMYSESAIPLFSIISGEINPNVVERQRKKISSEGQAVSKTIYTKFPINNFVSVKLGYRWIIPISGESKGVGSITLTATETSKTIHEYGYDIGAVSISNITENSFTITISTEGGTGIDITDEMFAYTTTSPSSVRVEYGAYPSDNVEALLKLGNGISDISKSNALAVDWNGNGYFGGELYANCDENSANGKRVITTSDALISDIRVLPSTTSYVFSANEYRNDLMPIIGTKNGYVPIVYSVECSNSQSIDVVNWSTYGTEGYVEVHAINRSSSSRSGIKFKIKILWIPEDLIATDNGSFIDITGGGSPSPDTPSGGNGINLPDDGEVGDMLVKGEIALEWEHKERLTNTEIEDMINAMA